jgi:hypothetical protein
MTKNTYKLRKATNPDTLYIAVGAKLLHRKKKNCGLNTCYIKLLAAAINGIVVCVINYVPRQHDGWGSGGVAPPNLNYGIKRW